MQPVPLRARAASGDLSQQKAQPGTPSQWKSDVEALQREVLIIWFLVRGSRTPWLTRVMAGGVAAYVLSPVQLIPSFIPVIGLADDFFVMALGMSLIRALTPKRVLEEAREHALAALARGDNVRAAAVRAITITIAVICLALSIAMFWFCTGGDFSHGRR